MHVGVGLYHKEIRSKAHEFPAYLAMFFNQDEDTASVQAHMAWAPGCQTEKCTGSDRGGRPLPVLAMQEAKTEASHSCQVGHLIYFSRQTLKTIPLYNSITESLAFAEGHSY